MFSLFLANVPFVFGQEEINELQEVDGFEKKDAYQKRLAHPNLQDILWIAKNFGVTQGWIHSEMAKGYALTHIYEGLLEQQQGGSYEVKIRNKRAARRSGPIGKSNRKQQGREGNEKKRKDDSWKPNPNKDINRPMKKHTPSPKHKGGKS